MGISLFLVLKEKKNKKALVIFAIQLALNKELSPNIYTCRYIDDSLFNLGEFCCYFEFFNS